MAQPAHVPKFGNLDRDNIPYTKFFENACKDKSVGRKNFNPNDPEENPDAFVSGIFPTEFELKNNEPDIYAVVTPPKNKYGSNQDDDELRQEYREVPVKKNRKFANSGSGSDRSSSDHSIPYPPNRRPSRHSDEDSVQIAGLQKSAPRPGRYSQRDAMHDTPSSVPKFGVWDERDPKSRDGFTVIFNKVKQEKQVAATKLPKVPTDLIIYPSNHKNHAKSSSRPKMMCCFSPAAKN